MPEKTLQDEISNRLRRIEGQVRGIEKMLDEGRDCEDMLTQTMAIRSAVDQVGARLMEYHLDRCLLEGFDCEPERMESLRQALKLWTRFGQPAPAMSLPYEAGN
ncbi:MAG: metal-sensitive transcriptional regulator [Chloroflexota bacterium]|nr:metal-sensitive transcriptional regulator [Chloroflexota bacterium]